MSTPRRVALDDSVRRAEIITSRGSFATLSCQPSESALPHGDVLLVPGFTGSKEDFGPILPLLAAAGWRATAFDQRGQFQTPAAEGDDLSLDGFAADLVAVADALFGRGEGVHLVGHSFGGLVAATAAVQRPELWASVTLLCSGPGALPGSQAEELRQAAERIDRDGLESSYQAKRAYDAGRGQPEPAADVEEFLHRRFVSNSAASLSAIARLLASAPDRTDDLAGLGIPVAVVRGAADDAWPHEAQERMAARLGTEVVVVEDSGHSPAVEAPEALRDALVRLWLASPA